MLGVRVRYCSADHQRGRASMSSKASIWRHRAVTSGTCNEASPGATRHTACCRRQSPHCRCWSRRDLRRATSRRSASTSLVSWRCWATLSSSFWQGRKRDHHHHHHHHHHNSILIIKIVKKKLRACNVKQQ